jgi:Tol biopolymer transport system component
MYLYTIGSDGSNMQRVSSNSNVEGTYNYSPDEQWIAYETYFEADGNSEIYVMKSDGSDPRKLVVHAQNDFRPVWSPDGSRIYFILTWVIESVRSFLSTRMAPG